MDVVVTVPRRLWQDWIEEGDLPGEPWSGWESFFCTGRTRPRIVAGERVYIVALGRLRGYAPLVRVDHRCLSHRERAMTHYSLVRRAGAEALTIPSRVVGFQGYRYRWWERSEEIAFPDWRDVDG